MRFRFRRVLSVVVGVLAMVAGVALFRPLPAGAGGPVVPPALAVPAGNELYLVGHARGYQIYECRSLNGNGSFGWVLSAPWAGLVDDQGKSLAIHYGGPTWQGGDNSRVVAARIASAPAPIPTAIPWLLLQATSTTGGSNSTFGPTTYIQRINTTGGLAPTTGCDAARVGATRAIFYTADYYFYRAA